VRRALVALALAGCSQILGITDPKSGSGSGSDDGGVMNTEHIDVPSSPNDDLDLLFVVDDSSSTADKQANLAANFPNLINVLNTSANGLPNLHLGVVSTDLGTLDATGATGPMIGSGPGACSGTGKGGILQLGSAGNMVTGKFVSDVRDTTTGGRIANYTGQLADVFSAMTQLGSNGCGFEQTLEAAEIALSTSTTANAGFLRQNALLGIVVVTDEDDCSMSHNALLGNDNATLGALQSFRCTRFGVTCDTGGTTTDEMNTVGAKDQCHSDTTGQFLVPSHVYGDFFAGLKANPQDVMIGVIAAPPTPFAVELRAPAGGGTPVPALAHSCNFVDAGGQEVGDPAVRIFDMLQSFTGRSFFTTVCQQDLSAPLLQIGQQLRQAAGGVACFQHMLADGDNVTPGFQPSCTVKDVNGPTTTVLDECDATASNQPCWQIVSNPTDCMTGSHQELNVERSVQPAAGTHVVADCQIVPGS